MLPSLKQGEVLRERYQVREKIGQGGAGSIYLANDLRLAGRLCALKEVEYNRAFPNDILEQAREQFSREATVLARLDHPNLPKVSDFFSIDLRDYIIMDYVPGQDLRSMIQNSKRQKIFLDEQDILGWAAQLADALIYLHDQNPPIIHRDIKPSNLKLTPSGLIKLVDFGLVKILAPEEVTITIIHGQGTALYTPIEQYGGDDAHTDIRADIYSFAATLYHLLTNEPPTEARKRFIDPSSLIRPREFNPHISQRVEKTVLWAMSLHPDDRPNSIQEFRQALLDGRDIPHRQYNTSSAFNIPNFSLILTNSETIFAWVTAGMFLLSFLLTITR